MIGTEKQIKYANDIKSKVLDNIDWLEKTYEVKTEFTEVQNILNGDNAKTIIETLNDWQSNFPYGLAEKEQSMRVDKKALEVFGKTYDELNLKEQHEVVKNEKFYSQFYSKLSDAERKLKKREWAEREKRLKGERE